MQHQAKNDDIRLKSGLKRRRHNVNLIKTRCFFTAGKTSREENYTVLNEKAISSNFT